MNPRPSSDLNRDFRLVNGRGMIDLAEGEQLPGQLFGERSTRGSERCSIKCSPRATFMATEASVLVSPRAI